MHDFIPARWVWSVESSSLSQLGQVSAARAESTKTRVVGATRYGLGRPPA